MSLVNNVLSTLPRLFQHLILQHSPNPDTCQRLWDREQPHKTCRVDRERKDAWNTGSCSVEQSRFPAWGPQMSLRAPDSLCKNLPVFSPLGFFPYWSKTCAQWNTQQTLSLQSHKPGQLRTPDTPPSGYRHFPLHLLWSSCEPLSSHLPVMHAAPPGWFRSSPLQPSDS